MSNFTIEGRALADGFKDIQRSWLWELTIALPGTLVAKLQVQNPALYGNISNRLMVHCRTATIPGRSTTPIESNFGGMKQWFAGKSEFTGTFAVTVEENEDMFVRTLFHHWQEWIFSVGGKSLTQGFSPVGNKRSNLSTLEDGYTSPQMELQLYKFNGDPTDQKFVFVNGFIQNIGDAALSYEDNSSIKFDVTFQYDFFDIVNG